MTPEEVNDMLTGISISDKLIENDEFSAAAWYTALAHVPKEQALAISVAYYANRDPGAGSITPGYIRRQAAAENERNASKRAALERGHRDAPSFHNQLSKLFRSPEFQATMNQASLDHYADLERRGITLTPAQIKRRHHITTGQTETLPPSPGGFFS